MKLVRCVTPALFVALISCDGDRITPPLEDRSGPNLTIELPDGFDSDGDNLVDMRLYWSDSAGVDVGSLHISVGGGNDLAKVWTIASIDSAGAVLEESYAGLLPGGAAQVDVKVSDRLGNVSQRSATVNLPAASFHKSILATRQWNGRDHGTVAVICDDHRLYVPAGQYLTVIDADSAKLIGEFRNQYAYEMFGAACAENPDLLYTADHAQRFDRNGMTWLPSGNAVGAASSIAISSGASKFLFIGEDGSGSVGVYERASEKRTHELPIPYAKSNQEYVFDLVVMPGDRKLYGTRQEDGGIAVIDTAVGIVKIIKVSGDAWTYRGRVDDLDLSVDKTRLYGAVMDGGSRGVAVIDTRTDELLDVIPIPGFALPQTVAVSPSGKRVFVATQDLNGVHSENWLFDISNRMALAHFPRPRTAPVRWDGGVVFHPSGKLIFVARDIHVDVYLNRE